jgi:hypothetical protein
MLEGKHNDSDYVKKMAYDRYEKLLRKNELWLRESSLR